MTEKESEIHDQGYSEGQRMLLIRWLRQIHRDLGYDDPETKRSSWIIEREEAISMLRTTCRDFGDLDWQEDLHLSDIIDKHLARHLHA